MSAIRRKLIGAVVALGFAASFVVVMAGPAPAADYNFACNDIGNLDGYEPCVGDRWTVGPGQFLRITNVASGGKSVRFRAYNVSGHHLLGTSANLGTGGTGLLWRNDTAGGISVDVEADPDACCVTVNVNARASITDS